MRTAIFPGTFDPLHLGHLDIIRRAANLFDVLYIAIGLNSDKQPTIFTVEERLELIEKITENIPNVEVVAFDGLLVDYAQDRSIPIIVRSIRNMVDFDSEIVLAHMNRKMSGIETLYLLPDESYRLINSSRIKELARHGKRLNDFVPAEIEPDIFNRLNGLG